MKVCYKLKSEENSSLGSPKYCTFIVSIFQFKISALTYLTILSYFYVKPRISGSSILSLPTCVQGRVDVV